MPDADNTVFISYRRAVASFIARAIFMDLRTHGYDVFMDVESIDSGAFDTIILNQIAARAHFVLILTPGTVERCAEPGDWLRREIETAMDLERNIVPVLVNDFRFDAASTTYLTGKLAGLPRYNALNAPHDYFDAAMDKLRTRFLKQPMAGSIVAAPSQDAPHVQRKIEQVAQQAAPSGEDLAAEEYFSLGYAADLEANYVLANDYYTRAIALNPALAHAFNNRGVNRGTAGDLDGALADYSEAIRLSPDDGDYYYNRGEIRFVQGDYAGALEDFRDSNALKPGFEYALMGLAVAHHALGNVEEAQRLWLVLIAIDDGYVTVDHVREQLGPDETLITEAQKIIDSLPEEDDD
ncbi:toll/interleukin-1 receptor domain-containing protein [Aggregatilinea lenta]|uniref:toll/interleukin-1 receptor domain-containing protein n=1 Tax=Aggregatilinea lenta TaxID=913108 RepID=UPI000E5B1216|nr:toll/interleukin-1 receptor domain-containing protein [Aggregatilinea lenta]